MASRQVLNRKAAIAAIKKHGILLVFPIDNAPEPQSLWSVAYPRSKMLWEWDESGDDRVARLWHLREELSRSDEVVYTKWYRGRATFFSRPVFTALLSVYLRSPSCRRGLSREAKEILELLETDSPLSTKALKRAAGLQGRPNEALYMRALKELWSRLLIVGYGEVDEGAFPSLAIGATKVLFEDLYNEAAKLPVAQSEAQVSSAFEKSPLAKKFHVRSLDSIEPRTAGRRRLGAYVDFESTQ